MCDCPTREVTLGGFIFTERDHIQPCTNKAESLLVGYMETKE